MSFNGGKVNKIQGNSSFWRPRGSSEDKQSAPSGNSQPNRSSAFSGGWGKPSSSNSQASGGRWGGPPGSSNPPASGGSGWGGQSSSFNRPAAVGGGWGRPPSQPIFSIVLITALLLLPGVTQLIADEFTKGYIQKNQIVTPHAQDDIDRAIEAFNRQHSQKPPAPPEGYTTEHVSYCFHQKYELPENLRETFEGFVQSYLTKNSKPFTMKLDTAVDRALLKIHESLSKENGEPIPEKEASRSAVKSSLDEFIERLANFFQKTYPWFSQNTFMEFRTHYMTLKKEDLVFSNSDIVDEFGRKLAVQYLYSELHFTHADYFFRTSFVNIFQIIGFPNGIVPINALPKTFRRPIQDATGERSEGIVPNAYFFVVRNGCPWDRISDSLRTWSHQSEKICAVFDVGSRMFVQSSPDHKTTGNIVLIMPAKIYTTVSRDRAREVTSWFAGGGSSYGDAPEVGIQINVYMKPDARDNGNYNPKNMLFSFEMLERIMEQQGARKLCVTKPM